MTGDQPDREDRRLAEADIDEVILQSSWLSEDAWRRLVPIRRRRLRVRQRMLGNEHPITIYAMTDLASVLFNSGEVAEAEQLQSQALVRLRTIYGNGGTTALDVAANLAAMRASLGNIEGAVELYREVVSGWRASLGGDHPVVTFLEDQVADLKHGPGPYSPSSAEDLTAVIDRGHTEPVAIVDIPERNEEFLSRDDLLNQLHRELVNEKMVLVSSGSEGQVGASELALEYVHSHARHYNLIWWIDAESPVSIMIGLSALARRLALPILPALEEDAAAAVDKLRQREGSLLVFDNARHPKDLDPFLSRVHSGHIMITTRYLDWPDLTSAIVIEPLTVADGSAMLLDRSGSSDYESAEGLARLALGLPLVLRLMTSYVVQEGLSLSEYLRRFREELNSIPAKKGLDLKSRVVRAAVWLSMRALDRQSVAAGDLLRLSVLLASNKHVVPWQLISAAPDVMSDPFCHAVMYRDEFSLALNTLRRYSLAETGDWTTVRLSRQLEETVWLNLSIGERRLWTRRAVQVVEAALPKESANYPVSWIACGELLPSALNVAFQAVKLGVYVGNAASVLVTLGSFLWSRSQNDMAKELLETAINIGETMGGQDSFLALCFHYLGTILMDLGQFIGARTLLERALAMRTSLGEEDSLRAVTMINLGEVSRRERDLRTARTLLEESVTILKNGPEPTHPTVAVALNNLGLVLCDLGSYSAAREAFREAISIYETNVEPGDPGLARAQSNLSKCDRLEKGES